MAFEILTAPQMGEADWAHWRALRAENPALDSPYYAPAYAQLADQIVAPVYIAVQHEGGAANAYFPFHRDGRRGRPLTDPLNDFEGPIAAAGTAIDVSGFMQAARITRMRLDHLPARDDGLAAYCEERLPNYYADMRGGLETYRGTLSKTGRRWLSDTARKSRQVVEALGPLRLEFNLRSHELLDTVLDWKRRQYIETGAHAGLDEAWRPRLLHALLDTDTPELAGDLSALYAGDTLVAAHFGIRGGEVLHYWYPVYDPQYGQWSPGRAWISAYIEQAAPALGLARMDYGAGETDAKRNTASGAAPMMRLTLDRYRWRAALRRHWVGTRQRLRQSPAYARLRQWKHRLLGAR